MINLALIGKDISHSKSAKIYEELLGESINYDLLDCPSENEIPSLNQLSKKYQGINITSPYKKFFFNDVEISNDVKSLGAINCISFESSGPIGTNTDYLALLKIIENFIDMYPKVYFLIFGDGVMSKITQNVLNKLGMKYEIISRKSFPSISQYQINQNLLSENDQVIIFNACSRDFIYSGDLPSGVTFYDYNYDFLPHKEQFSAQECIYIDGIELLVKQATYALEFMKLKK
jgi:shikimate dehydrogenase